jgi:DNA polymerase/3'-5' exonuclease PolX
MGTLERPKIKYPRAAAIEVVREMLAYLAPCCSRIIVAGSLRRKRPEVGDIEFLYIPNMVKGPDPSDLFGKEITHNAVDVALRILIEKGVLEKRLSVIGRESWGANNKLARHRASGIPIDLFAANHENWFSLLVCRTGPAESNVRVCEAAIELGFKWEPYSGGFARPSWSQGESHELKMCRSEEEVFAFVGLPYLPPEERK